MRKDTFDITASHLFLPISAQSVESNSYIMRFNIYGTYQINQSNFLISRNTVVQVL
jgi:hypothetical protein